MEVNIAVICDYLFLCNQLRSIDTTPKPMANSSSARRDIRKNLRTLERSGMAIQAKIAQENNNLKRAMAKNDKKGIRKKKKKSRVPGSNLRREKKIELFFPTSLTKITGALQCLKRKKIYDEQLLQLSNSQFQLESQIFAIESANTNLSVLQAMRMGASTVDSVMDQIEEQLDMAREISSALGQPATKFDEDDLEAELAELETESLDSLSLPRLSLAAAPSSSSPSASSSSSSSSSSSLSEDEELAALAESLGMGSPPSISSIYSSPASVSPSKR